MTSGGTTGRSPDNVYNLCQEETLLFAGLHASNSKIGTARMDFLVKLSEEACWVA